MSEYLPTIIEARGFSLAYHSDIDRFMLRFPSSEAEISFVPERLVALATFLAEDIGMAELSPASIVLAMRKFPDEQRLAIMARFCSHCGCEQPETGRPCQCWNDE